MRFSEFKQELLEGVYDPGIFKAFFLAGGAGSGKSYSAEKATGSASGKFQWHEKIENKIIPGKVGPYGLKVVNSDEQLEFGLMKAKMHSDMTKYSDDETMEKERIRKRGKKITKKREQLWINGRLGLIIDGTAKNPTKLSVTKQDLEAVGYSTYMIFVNTSLDVALQNNAGRARKLKDEVVRATWDEVQLVKDQLANLFPGRFVEIVNNRAGEDVFRKSFVEIGKLIKRPPSSPLAKAWIAHELESKAQQ
jgi:predicted kinase|tara:strand:- start:4369 stop:5118 length:750 start_codon:yes stop_codon:yes gene_type:complete